MLSRNVRGILYAVAGTAAISFILVQRAILPPPTTLAPQSTTHAKLQVLDRRGAPLSYTFTGEWNTTNYLPLHRIPVLLQQACIEAEDHRFFYHSGVDWLARAHAAWQNIKARRVVRGASTISEQVVRILHPRPRSLWARLIEGIEAQQLEQRFSKADILEFYLNQIPFAENRRGIAQAARHFWDRDVETLTERELISLVVMIRAPERLSLHRDPERVRSRVSTLARHLVVHGSIDATTLLHLESETTPIRRETLPVHAEHFVRYIQTLNANIASAAPIRSTLDPGIQSSVQAILEARLRDLESKHVTDGAVLVIDNHSAEVLAWVNAGNFSQTDASQIDAIVTARQPGSTLKPFLYALAIARGWSAATILSDSPLVEPVGTGLHVYRNYSRMYYGDITLREALGNSLNIPAIRTIQFTGKSDFLGLLHSLGFASLTKPVEFYGEGLALGNGEVSLLELVRGYLTFAHRGVYRPLIFSRDSTTSSLSRSNRVFDAETTSLIGHILSDPLARRREFGSDGLLNFPIQTAVKTGTSNDYRDAWAVGFSNNFTVGVWMGNHDRTSMSSISGARGPALVLRSVFASLEQTRQDRGLYLSPRLSHISVCSKSGKIASSQCSPVTELFTPGSEPQETCTLAHSLREHQANEIHAISHVAHTRIVVPTPGLHVALDPRVPDSLEALGFELTSELSLKEVQWIVDGALIHKGGAEAMRHLWPLQVGKHTVKVYVLPEGTRGYVELPEVGFVVR
jgi:penicillin-binding protein 1C